MTHRDREWRVHGLRKQCCELHERDQCAQRELLIGAYPRSAVPQHERRASGGEHRHQRHVDTRENRAAHRPKVHLGRKCLKLREICIFTRERLCGARTEQHLAVRGGHRARNASRLAARAKQKALKNRARERHQGHRRECPQREALIDPKHRGDNTDENRRTPREIEHDPRENSCDLRTIARES